MSDSQNRTVLAAVVALVAVGAVAGLLLTGGVLLDGSAGDDATPTDDAASAGLADDDDASAAVESTPSPTPASGGAAAGDATPTPEPATHTPATATPTTDTPTPEEEDSSSGGSSSANPGGGSPSDDDDSDDDSNDSNNSNDSTDDGSGGSDGADDGSDTAPSYAVAADGSAEYQSIQAAVDDASEGDDVTVAPGTYEEQVRIAKNVSLLAPDGATLSGENLTAAPSTGVEISAAGGPVAPTVSGFHVQGYDYGVLANGTSGDWTLNGTAIDGAPYGVDASNTSGDWTVRNASIDDAAHTAVLANESTGDWTVAGFVVPGSPRTAINASRSTGDWAVRNGAIVDAQTSVDARNSSGSWRMATVNVYDGQTGLDAEHTTGAWAIEDSTFTRNGKVGVDAADADGDWSVRGTALRNGKYGVFANQTTGDWTIRNASLLDTQLVGVLAAGGSGSWTVTNSAFVTQSNHAIVASGASPDGDATGNWWGSPDGAASDDCVANVDCGDPLATLPDEVLPTDRPAEIDLREPSAWSYDDVDWVSQVPRLSVDRPLVLANGSRYEFVVNDTDAGGRVVVTPSANETIPAGQSTYLVVPKLDEIPGAVIGGLGSEHDVPAEVTRHGSVTTAGVTNLSVSLRRADTDETLATTTEQPYIVGYRPDYAQNSTNGTIEVAVDRSVLPADAEMNATVFRSGTTTSEANEDDGRDPANTTDVALTYDVDRDVFVGTFDAASLENGTYDVRVDGRLPAPYETNFTEESKAIFTVEDA